MFSTATAEPQLCSARRDSTSVFAQHGAGRIEKSLGTAPALRSVRILTICRKICLLAKGFSGDSGVNGAKSRAVLDGLTVSPWICIVRSTPPSISLARARRRGHVQRQTHDPQPAASRSHAATAPLAVGLKMSAPAHPAAADRLDQWRFRCCIRPLAPEPEWYALGLPPLSQAMIRIARSTSPARK